MKKYSLIILIALIAGFSCKKSSDPKPPKDYGATIKDKTWWGTFTFTGQTTQYYTVHFKADSSLIWSQWSGDYPGKWSISGNKLKITYTANVITADITDDGKLMNIEDNFTTYVINKCEQLANPNMSLDNQVWKGVEIVGGVTNPLQLNFMPGTSVETKKGNTTYAVKVYSRSPSGAAIRFTVLSAFTFFGVVTSETVIKGCENSTENLWQVTKQ